MAMGILAQLPGGEVQHVPVSPKLLLEGCLSEVARRLRQVLSPALGIVAKAGCIDDHGDDKNLGVEECEEPEEDVDDDYRILFRGRDLEDESIASAFLEMLESGRPCMVRVLFRLLGGKGGFGSLLRSQKGGKKTTNFDAMRDLNGRRIRHVKAVERIKDWLEQKKRDDELVKMLTGEGPELPKPTPESETLDPNFLKRLKSAAASRPGLVDEGLRHLLDQTDDAEEEITKRARTDSSAASSAASSSHAGSAAVAAPAPSKDSDSAGDDGDSVNWLGALDSLGGLSSPDSDDKEDEPAADSAASSSSSAAKKASG